MALFSANSALGQSAIPENVRGNEAWIARGILDGNLIETNFRNHGELSRWNDLPWGIWPRGVGGRHVDGVGMMIAAQVPGEREKWQQFYPGQADTTLNPVILTYREAGKRTGPSGELWGWLPLTGFHNQNRFDPITGAREPVPALSDDATSWPDFWPDRLDNPDDPGWAGNWNGFFGRGVFNADLESFYVVDDHSDQEYAIDTTLGTPNSEYGVFYPSPGDSTMGGLGLQTQVRIFQWANILAEDVMFILYRVTNVGETNHDRLYFTQINDYGLGNEEGDENAAFDPQQDVAYGWDQDGIGTRATGGSYALGYTGFAFLESPARAFDGLDNDEDGITDESRFDGPGMLIEGEDAILLAAAGRYDVTRFEIFNGPIAERPATQAGRWWTGDENMDWVGFSDDNGNGVWDQGESVNNDVGQDGLGPFDFGYPGPDTGETDGIPSRGEPNFDELDVDESDQVGLTGYDLNTRPFYENGNNLRDDSWLWDRVFNFSLFPLGTPPAAFAADIEPFLVFVSGPIGLRPNSTDFFSTAWVFGADETDFFKNRRTVQSIFNADYSFAQPPFLPKLAAVPGDGRVTLSWDTTSVVSFDRFTQEFDFQGYKLYRGTDPLFTDSRSITNIDGTPTFFRPIAQWDLDDGINGPITVLDGEGVYNLGEDTGLDFFYIDDDVTNGITYYYALVAYDRGFGDPNDPSSEAIDPQENTFNVSVTQAGNLVGVSQNAAVVTPRSLPVGFVAGGANEDLSAPTVGRGTGSLGLDVVDEDAVVEDNVYQVRFFSEYLREGSNLYETTGYELLNVTSGATLISKTPLVEATPLTDGFSVEISNVNTFTRITEETGYVANIGSPNEVISTNPAELDGYSTNWAIEVIDDSTTSFAQSSDNYELRWVNANDSTYRPPRVFGFLREDVPFFGVNTTTNETTELLIEDINESGVLDPGDDIIISEREGSQPRRFRHRVRIIDDGSGTSVAPSPGQVLRISVNRPFFEGDMFQFTVRSSAIDADLARSEMDRIAVVPNPYVGASEFEPRTQLEGRGERRVQFIHLPPRCTIKIFNIRGELIRVIEHDGVRTDGSEYWDLKTSGQQDVAYGVYIFHVEAPGIGEHIGKFALVK